MASSNLVIRAGARAAERLREEGFHADLFGTLVGASGGPKWLVLRHVDDVLIDRVVRPRQTPLDTLGSSIGSFRHACFAQADPRAALARFERGYIEQSYDGEGQPSMEAISEESERILGELLGEGGAREICSHPLVQSHLVAARLQRDRGLDRGRAFQIQLGAAALRNAVGRRRLGRSFERILFYTPGDHGAADEASVSGPEGADRPGEASASRQPGSPRARGGPAIRFEDLPTHAIPLTPGRVPHALLASGSIPLVMAGVRSTPGLPGTLFDGGIVDYHFDFEFHRRDGGLVLFAHFFDRITPGWFDKPLRWRRPRTAALDDVVMVAPSDAFVAALPGGKVPDRRDFLDFPTEERILRWRGIVERCRVLAEELGEAIDGGRIGERIEPFSP